MSATPTSGVPVPTESSIWYESPYHYIPTESVCIIFVVLFSVSTLVHFLMMLRYRLWWLAPTVLLGGAGEIIGWSGRLWSSLNFIANDPFTIQITCTIIAPTPFLAAIFITFGQMVRRLGERYSVLSAGRYSRIFLTFDIVCLVIQAAGGGIASGANTDSGTKLGSNIMLAGIIAQMVALGIFMCLAAQFFFCFLTNRPVRRGAIPPSSSDVTLNNMGKRNWDLKLKLLSGAIAFITTVLMIRAVYRTIELADGWNGAVIATQKWFNIFDGMMVVLAFYTLNFFHPGPLLFANWKKESVETINVQAEAKRTVDSLGTPLSV